ncbi:MULTISPECIES: FAD-dependent monooxygenase [unclassified Chelatococcus]|uniref:FAD-dependent monooxygenase n=1 Tax=unclassified Chelatococcus TaxID=2638111 RepID=UPI001BD0641B|nr:MULTISPECIES: FAD-dependent monooxygenase [unclassified Chelatococcus]CAH1661091.1 3-(3-hydroxy-phenyl)propionate/3-hydroxycinnamic acid hydroxylase [Hyphomicrobiales bacterium]MBS7741211.1 FAD-dependent monooxygenase [Chelatococcus sp. HY11]MBX3545397.1 FAD-dependent monooxygenase [Chelatococcus sp.]MCO5078033.1 FAD-dependent monooxygenase [Chelatococcus sp.]CAH1683206.1 3-(3-hydroxy-phenyl)propionate/3-hydroxycinnamic acid hydroxylase [Hyphomicrobiales bacterium]
METTAVLIVGAGPVGLMLANQLQRQGIAHVLIDRQLEHSFFCKALGVTARTLEIFDDLGIADEAIDRGVWLRGLRTFDNGEQVAAFDLPERDLPFGALSLAQYETEDLLEMSLRRHGGGVARGWRLDRFVEDADGVQAELVREGDDPAVTRTLRCQWLVGCDGAHSRVRAALGLSFEGGKFPQTFVLGDLDIDWSLPRGYFYRFSTHRDGQQPNSLAAVPVHGSVRRYRLSTMLQDGPELAMPEGVEATPPDLERLTAIVQSGLPQGTRLSNLRWSSLYRVSHRIVPSYGKGRVFLAGDAAHIHPPVGGQGMNTGLQDANNLAWKLALAARGLAAEGLLQSYDAERRPVGLDVVEGTSRALNAVLSQQATMPGVKETQLLISYPESPIIVRSKAGVETGLQAGDRAPDAYGLVRPFVAHPARLHERLGKGKHRLLCYAGQEGFAPFSALVRELAARLPGCSGSLGIVAKGAPPADDEAIPLLQDAADNFRSSYNAVPGMAWLVRPDGHLAWIGHAEEIAELSSALDLVAAIRSAEL